jgi:hypothetical protein
MATPLNLTLPLKQDAEVFQKLQNLAATFTKTLQPKIEAALTKSQTVHYARFLVIDNKYIQVLTEFDGDFIDYTEFFRKELPDAFQLVFSMVEGAPNWEELNSPDGFLKFINKHNLKSLGGYLYSSIGDVTVREIKALIEHK